MNSMTLSICLFAGAFLLGSIPWGHIAGRIGGIDIRQHGSGNIGATNVFRVMGKGWGITVFALDFLKGLVAALGCGLVAEGGEISSDIASIIGGLAAILGHNFTPWLGFKGGKGIASSAGVLFGITPAAATLALSLWIALFFTTRYVSVASIAAAASLPVFTALPLLIPSLDWLPGGTWPLFFFCLTIGALAIFRHESNIKRLLAGTEPRFERKGKSPAPSTSGQPGPQKP